MNKEKKESKKSNQERIDACDYLASAASSMDWHRTHPFRSHFQGGA